MHENGLFGCALMWNLNRCGVGSALRSTGMIDTRRRRKEESARRGCRHELPSWWETNVDVIKMERILVITIR